MTGMTHYSHQRRWNRRFGSEKNQTIAINVRKPLEPSNLDLRCLMALDGCQHENSYFSDFDDLAGPFKMNPKNNCIKPEHASFMALLRFQAFDFSCVGHLEPLKQGHKGPVKDTKNMPRMKGQGRSSSGFLCCFHSLLPVLLLAESRKDVCWRCEQPPWGQ